MHDVLSKLALWITTQLQADPKIMTKMWKPNQLFLVICAHPLPCSLYIIFLRLIWCESQLVYILTNPMNPEINDDVSL